jgi:hypothetical protein
MYSEKYPPPPAVARRVQHADLGEISIAGSVKTEPAVRETQILSALNRLDRAAKYNEELAGAIRDRFVTVLRAADTASDASKGEPQPNTPLASWLTEVAARIENTNDRMRDTLERCELPTGT